MRHAAWSMSSIIILRGTKQLTGSRLDRMVERERAVAVNAIMNYLHDKTGDDLGAKPEAWIQKYAKR